MNIEHSGQRLLACTLLTMLLATASHAQDQLDLEVLELPAITPYAPPTEPSTEQNAFTPTVTFEARLTDEGEPMEAGLIWRVFGVTPASDGKLPLIATAQGGTTSLQLQPGSYYVHTTFGRASASTRLDVGFEPITQTVILKAGGLRLDAMLPDGSRMRREQLRFDIYDGLVDESTGERGLIIPDVPAGRIVRLPEGTYHVVSRYGDINAEIRADLRVQAGKTVNASIEHRAAQVTLNLVRANSGFPLPDTAWSVLDSSTGDIINERIGAFPSMVLAAGEYTAIAKHRDRLFRREFVVSPGSDITVRINTENDEVPSEG
ncbi:MAG: hypothetical protein AAFR39_13260 [Pseudomonadota bacterium]